MKLSSIPAIYRNVNRTTEIVSVLSRYGLADWLSRLNLEFAKGWLKDRNGAVLARQSREVRIRLAITELGPTFIKLGQILSTRPDVIGQELADELRLLRDAAPADPPDIVEQTIQHELGQSCEQLFREFDTTPIASASIGQVHRAVLFDGDVVAVKVQRAGIADMIRKDMEVMSGLAQLAAMLPEFAPFRPVETLAEIQRVLRRELNYSREEQNLDHFNRCFRHHTSIRIPRPYHELCSPRVLTMEYIAGARLNDVERLRAEGYDLDAVARQGAELYLQMIFVDGLYHADPHPGNVLLLPDNVIGLLDFGMIGRVDEEFRDQFEELLTAMVWRDAALLADTIARLGRTPRSLDMIAFRSDLAEFVSHYTNQPLDEICLSSALREMTDIIHQYRISLPPQVSLLMKTLITLEGTARLLNPQFSLMEVIQPFQRKAMLRRLSPVRRIKKLRRAMLEFEHLASILPRRTLQLLEQMQSGELNLKMEHRGMGPSVNRLVLGLLASALFLGSSLLLAHEVPPILFATPWMGLHRLSMLGLIGCVLSCLLTIRLLLAIVKSGHLDRRE